MSFLTFLSTLFIGPLKLVFELIFGVALSFVNNPGLAIIFLSLAMNILVLPLYRRADAMQEEARDIENKLSRGVAHIKKTFSGDERMMILQTYYRQNNYKPTDALNGSVSLLLEIPFFMAAYQFLSHLDILDGVAFGPIKDLGAPDGLIVIGGLAINLLPVLMTLVNVISSALYLKGFPLKTKVQLYGMALFFLVFLYTSPACLVFYWTLNNVFSLVKTILYKVKNPQRIIRCITTAAGAFFIGYGVFVYNGTVKRTAFLVLIGVALLLPLVMHFVKRKVQKPVIRKEYTANRKVFVLAGLFLTLLVGVLIPSTYISSSPQEFVDIGYYHNPLWYIVSSVAMAAGFFLVWMGVFYWLANKKGKVVFERLMCVLCGVMFVNYMFFGTNLGVISSTLQYENGLFFKAPDQLINVVILAAVAALIYFCIVKWKRAASGVLIVAVLAVGGMSAVNAVTIGNSIADLTHGKESTMMPDFNLTKKGQNVVVIMLDRAMGEYVPYIFNEKPELEEKFDGFTYYSNVISFGGYTNFGTPALLGGYEYTPVEMNKRDNEPLVDKHNEALKVMPVIFAENKFDVTVCDPVYANYKWIPDLSLFDEYKGKKSKIKIKTRISNGKFDNLEEKKRVIEDTHRNFFCFSLMKAMPVSLQPSIYNNGNYNKLKSTKHEDTVYTVQTASGMSVATGTNAKFMKGYGAIDNLETMTKITKGDKNTFLLLTNDMTHEPQLLQTPDYVPSTNVDNTEYDKAHSDRFTVDGQTLKVNSVLRMQHYHINMSAMLRLGEWFDYLRENGLYDNTKIILVADHGRDLGQIESLVMGDESYEDAEYYFPLLMVKDFGSKGFTTSDEFMTNADVPMLAMDGLIDDPINPFTGNKITNSEKYAHDQFIILSEEYDVEVNNGNTFLPSKWASVHTNLWDRNNWTFYEPETVLKEHAAP